MPSVAHNLAQARASLAALSAAGPDEEGGRRSRLAQVTKLVAVGTTGWHLVKEARQQLTEWRDRQAYHVVIHDHDDLYFYVHEWVLEQLAEEDRRNLRAITRRSLSEVVQGERQEQWKVQLHYDGTRTQELVIEGHPVRVSVEEVEEAGSKGLGDLSKPRKVVFRCVDQAGRDAVLAALQGLADLRGRTERNPRLITTGRWGDWRVVGHEKPRPLSTVHLPEGVAEGVLADLRLFLDSEDEYLRLGLPWHRGYLFYGPPGTGKTSLARALASELGMDLYHMPLGDLAKDVVLNELAGGVSQRSALLLEDVDVATSASHERADADDDDGHDAGQGVTLAGLLNMLDGVTTPHGLVVFMTTNFRDALDPALTRPGRADLDLELGYVAEREAWALLARLTGWAEDESWDVLSGGMPWPKVTPADLVGCVKEHLHDKRAGFEAALDLLQREAKNLG